MCNSADPERLAALDRARFEMLTWSASAEVWATSLASSTEDPGRTLPILANGTDRIAGRDLDAWDRLQLWDYDPCELSWLIEPPISEERDFARGAFEPPNHCDVPRLLIFADWLEERGAAFRAMILRIALSVLGGSGDRGGSFGRAEALRALRILLLGGPRRSWSRS